MITCFDTETGSTYEVDEARKLVRRVAGKGNPTPRVGHDHIWKQYKDINGVEVGGVAMITWNVSEDEFSLPLYQCTMTSKIVKVYERVVQ